MLETVKENVPETLMQSLDNHSNSVLAKAEILENRVRELNGLLFNYEEPFLTEKEGSSSLDGKLHVCLKDIESIISEAIRLLNKI